MPGGQQAGGGNVSVQRRKARRVSFPGAHSLHALEILDAGGVLWRAQLSSDPELSQIHIIERGPGEVNRGDRSVLPQLHHPAGCGVCAFGERERKSRMSPRQSSTAILLGLLLLSVCFAYFNHF